MQITRVIADLPDGFEELRMEAAGEGHRHIERLAAEWRQGQRFDGEGEALFACTIEGELAGIGALVVDPEIARAARLRRFYVRAKFRKLGVGAALFNGAMQIGSHFAAYVLNAGTADAAAFWERMGFEPCSLSGVSHRLPMV